MIEVRDIRADLGEFVLDNVSFGLEKGDYLALLGVSGAGKTVVLEALAGLLKLDSGKVLLDGKDITNQKIQNRKMGLVYQDLSLFPHLSVFHNIAFPLKVKGVKHCNLKDQVKSFALEAGVEHLLHRMPGTLSGGEAQRVAFARTMASEPDVLLLDEPLSNLDVKLKGELKTLLRKINRQGKTIIHVTHDFMETATLANKVAVIQDGKLVQFGSPDQVFRHPKTEFVARFSGIKNVFAVNTIDEIDNQGLKLAKITENISFYFLCDTLRKKGFILIPQQDLVLSSASFESSALNQIKGEIKDVYFTGTGMELVVDVGIEIVSSVSHSSMIKMDLVPGKQVWVSFKASAVKFVES